VSEQKKTGRGSGLIPFKPGQSGNPGGRPKGFSLTRLVREALQKEDPTTRKQNAEMIADKVVELAKQGNIAMIPLVWRYIDGDPKSAAELSLRELAEQLADRLGLDAEELLGAFERDQKAS